jgi:hypothetical protein
MNTRTTLSALFALLLLAAVPAQAQTAISIGPRVGYETDAESIFVGADARIGVAALPIRLNPTFDFFLLNEDDFGNDASQIQLTVNALYELGIENTTFTPYAGGGLSYVRRSFDVPEDVDIEDSNSEIGLNVIGGAEFTNIGGFVPFAQGEFVLGGDYSPFKITGGILFDI